MAISWVNVLKCFGLVDIYQFVITMVVTLVVGTDVESVRDLEVNCVFVRVFVVWVLLAVV